MGIVQADDGAAEDDQPIVDDQGNEGDADATDAKRQEKQEEEVWPWRNSLTRLLRFSSRMLFLMTSLPIFEKSGQNI